MIFRSSLLALLPLVDSYSTATTTGRWKDQSGVLRNLQNATLPTGSIAPTTPTNTTMTTSAPTRAPISLEGGPNDQCSTAMRLQGSSTDETLVVGATTNGTAVELVCANAGGPAIWYSMIGTGARFKASTCTPETDFRTRLVVSSRGCDTVGVACEYDASDRDCDSSGNAATVEFFTEFGVEYNIAVTSTSPSIVGNFGLSLLEYVLPENNVCEDAIELEPRLDLSTQIVASTENATIEEVDCANTNGEIVWYSVLGSGARFRASTCHTETVFDTEILVSSRDCATVDAVCESNAVDRDCEGGLGSTLEWFTEKDTVYKVGVTGRYSSTDPGSFGLSVLEYMLPTNDVCASATVIEPRSDPGAHIIGSTANATIEDIECSNTNNAIVWYSVVGNGARFKVSTCHDETLFDTEVLVSNRNCTTVGTVCESNAVDRDCEGGLGSTIEWFSVKDTVYKIGVTGRYSSTDPGAFGLSVLEYVRPKNDVCQDAILLEPQTSSVGTVIGSLANATWSSIDCSGVNGPTTFYSVVGTGSRMKVSTCTPETFFKATLLVSGGSACDSVGFDSAGIECKFGNYDEGCDSELGSSVDWYTSNGTIYTIAITMSSYTANAGGYGLSLLEYARPANDDCVDAVAIESRLDDSVVVAGSTANATVNEFSCGSHEGPAVWYSVVGNGNRFRASTCTTATDHDAKVFVSGQSCSDGVGATCISDSSFDFCSGDGHILEWETEAGKVYMVAVSGSSSYATGIFGLSMQEISTTPMPTSAPGSLDVPTLFGTERDTSNGLYLSSSWLVGLVAGCAAAGATFW